MDNGGRLCGRMISAPTDPGILTFDVWAEGLIEMEDGYWDLFWQTGAPEFYLLRGEQRQEEPEEER